MQRLQLVNKFTFQCVGGYPMNLLSLTALALIDHPMPTRKVNINV